MTTAVTVVQSALGSIVAHSVINPSAIEVQNDGVYVLNGIIRRLHMDRWDTGATPPTLLADELYEYQGARTLLEYLVAQDMAVPLQKELSRDFVKAADVAIRSARRLFREEPTPAAHKPVIIGAGNCPS